MKRKMLGGFAVGLLFVLIGQSFAHASVVRVLDDWETRRIRGTACGDQHCVVYQQQESNPGCEDCALLWCTDTCWDHLDERCASGSPDNCDGHSTYQTFSRTCNECSINFWHACPGDPLLAVCDDEGDYNEGVAVYKCY